MNLGGLVVIGFGGKATKRLIILVVATLGIIMLLPMLAVVALGKDTLSFLWNTQADASVYAVSTDVQGVYQGPDIATDTYAWGNCTYWAYAMRLKYGNQIPNSWGNANTWDDRAIRDGYQVDHVPTVGAVYQTDAGELGHVAYVMAVDPSSGDWTISEMNARGLDVVDQRTFRAGAALFVNFIHDKLVHD